MSNSNPYQRFLASRQNAAPEVPVAAVVAEPSADTYIQSIAAEISGAEEAVEEAIEKVTEEVAAIESEVPAEMPVGITDQAPAAEWRSNRRKY